jgi:hypothetical protein
MVGPLDTNRSRRPINTAKQTDTYLDCGGLIAIERHIYTIGIVDATCYSDGFLIRIPCSVATTKLPANRGPNSSTTVLTT